MIMKKKFSNTDIIMTCLLLAAFSFTSCKKLIEIPATLPSSITQEQQFADSATAVTAVAGVYAYNVGNGFAYSDARLNYSTGLSADELAYTSTEDDQQFFNYSLTPLNGGISTLWAYPYQSIYQVNAVLNGVTGNSGLSPGFQKQVIGEMEVVRALYYFNLVNLFGDVPLITSTDYKLTSRTPRTSVAIIYHQIIKDLADARRNLKATYPSAGRARPNLYTAIALLAKVNLYQRNWQNAYNEADSVIRLGGYSLVTTGLDKVFLNGSTEAIWQLPANQGYYGAADAQYFVPSYTGAVPTYQVTASLLTAFEAGDQRLRNWLGSTIIGGQTAYYPYKYKNTTASTLPTEDQMVFRLAEMYLIRAEAAARLGNTVNLSQALADVNTIRKRAGLQISTADVTSQTAVINAVMKERQTELFCEWGNRWFDLKRTGTAAAVLGAVKTGFSINASLYPIPQTQIQLNNLLIQNPGYN
jgi:hypothetical protein